MPSAIHDLPSAMFFFPNEMLGRQCLCKSTSLIVKILSSESRLKVTLEVKSGDDGVSIGARCGQGWVYCDPPLATLGLRMGGAAHASHAVCTGRAEQARRALITPHRFSAVDTKTKTHLTKAIPTLTHTHVSTHALTNTASSKLRIVPQNSALRCSLGVVYIRWDA